MGMSTEQAPEEEKQGKFDESEGHRMAREKGILELDVSQHSMSGFPPPLIEPFRVSQIDQQ